MFPSKHFVSYWKRWDGSSSKENICKNLRDKDFKKMFLVTLDCLYLSRSDCEGKQKMRMFENGHRFFQKSYWSAYFHLLPYLHRVLRSWRLISTSKANVTSNIQPSPNTTVATSNPISFGYVSKGYPSPKRI